MKFFFAITLTFSVLAAVFAAISAPTKFTNKKEVTPITKNQSNCPKYCTSLENPVCAKNSYNKCFVIFGNPCKLDAYNCNRNRRDKFVRDDSKICEKYALPNNFYCWSDK